MDYCKEPNRTITYLAGRMYVEGTFFCEREEGHVGHHQQILDNHDGAKCTMASWNESFLNVRTDEMWPSKTCKDCSYRMPVNEEDCCPFCKFWNKVESDESYIVDGSVFKVLNQGWVPERVLKFISDDGVKEVERKFIKDCDVPHELRFRFPNNAVFKPVVSSGHAFVPFIEGLTSKEAMDMVPDYENWS